MDQERRTVTLDEWRGAVGLGRDATYELARRGEIPGLIRLGKRYLVSKAALERMLAEREPVTA